MLRKMLAGAALLAATLFGSAHAADPSYTSLPFTSGGTTYNECTYNDGTRFVPCSLGMGWTGSGYKPFNIDPNTGFLGVQLPPGAARSTDVQAVVTALGLAPMQQTGGSVSISGTPTVNLGSISGAATAAAQSSGNATLTAIQAELTSLTKVDSSGYQMVTVSNPNSTASSVAVTSSVLPAGASTATGVAAVVTALTPTGGLPIAAPTGGLPVTGPLTSAQLTAAGLSTQAGTAQIHTDLTQSGGLPVSGPATASQLAAALGPAPAQVGGKIDTVISSASTDIGAQFTGSAAVTIAVANTARRGVMYENQATTAGQDCWVSTVATATADYHSLKVPAGGLYESGSQHVGTGAISVICPSATTSAPIPFYGRSY